jgi:hypothetical protein
VDGVIATDATPTIGPVGVVTPSSYFLLNAVIAAMLAVVASSSPCHHVGAQSTIFGSSAFSRSRVGPVSSRTSRARFFSSIS